MDYYGFRCDIFCWLTENKDQGGRNPATLRQYERGLPTLADPAGGTEDMLSARCDAAHQTFCGPEYTNFALAVPVAGVRRAWVCSPIVSASLLP
jgi:hypothetical protein